MSQRLIDQSYYEILEISPDAAEHEIHVAYEKAKKTYSPDSPALYTMFSPEEANELSKLIEEAYAVLSNNTSRKAYDNRLLGRNDPIMEEKTPRERKSEPAARVQVQSASKEPVPDGFAKTRFGTYELNQEIESEISGCESFNGEFLFKVRSYKKVPIEILSNDIRVSKSYLMAIEKQDFEALPAPVFVRGFVVQYAKALGLDHEKVASSYMKIMKDGNQ